MKTHNKLLAVIIVPVLTFILVSCKSNKIDLSNLGIDVRATLTASGVVPQIETGGFEFDGLMRDYLVFLPKTYNKKASFPLVIYLHAKNWSPIEGMNHTQIHKVAESNNFLIVFPAGKDNWNSGLGDSIHHETPDNDDVGFIRALIDRMEKRYNIDSNRVYAVGYGNGGFMAYKLACQLSDRVAAIAIVQGLFTKSTAEDCNPSRAIPIMHIHGTDTHYVPFDGTEAWHSVDEALNYWTDFNNCLETASVMLEDKIKDDGCTVEKISYEKCADNANVLFYKVIDGGATWPGADDTSFGTTNRDINAGVEIWNFFNEHMLP